MNEEPVGVDSVKTYYRYLRYSIDYIDSTFRLFLSRYLKRKAVLVSAFNSIGSHLTTSKLPSGKLKKRIFPLTTTYGPAVSRTGNRQPKEGWGSPVVKVLDHDRHVMSSIPVPLKTRRVGQRCTLNLSRAEMSSRWCGVVIRSGGGQALGILKSWNPAPAMGGGVRYSTGGPKSPGYELVPTRGSNGTGPPKEL
ncbi:uncharacterized protein TNCV_1321031 [Trichonephila clavipes]|nr:uncharacterized protein TNCV_1321031 [Trichonephila clavipes]